MKTETFYETDAAVGQYLLFHYGEDSDLMPFAFGPQDALHFPVRCVTECLELDTLAPQARALDLGCAVGRTSFELSRYCGNVVAVDRSSAFITAAQELQQCGRLNYEILESGMRKAMRTARLPSGVKAERIKFICADVMEFAQAPQSYDIVIAANLLCRLPNPLAFLQVLPKLVSPNGHLVVTTPDSWLEEYTPRSLWLTTSLDALQEKLGEYFDLQRCFDMPFLIREHYRKYQWGVAQAMVWKRKLKDV